jgi:hypothetical protein
MRIRHWPITIVGGALLFATLGCDTTIDSTPAEDTASETDTVAIEDTNSDIAVGSDITQAIDVTSPEDSTEAEDVQVALDITEPVDTAIVDANQPEDIIGIEDTVGTLDVAVSQDVTDSNEPEDVTIAATDIEEVPDVAGVEDAESQTGPQAGDPCIHGMFDPAGVICTEEAPYEVALVCDGEFYVDPKDPDSSNINESCDCWETPDGTVEVVCASPGFVGIARANRDRIVTTRLRPILS